MSPDLSPYPASALVTREPDRCLADARDLREAKLCLREVSKDGEGRLRLVDRDMETCRRRNCATLTTVHSLVLDLVSHPDCDRAPSLDGRLVSAALTTVFADADPGRRGVHAGDFTWRSGATLISGTLSGITNAGIHREPVLEGCEECLAPGALTGRLCARVVRSRVRELEGCQIVGVYRLRAEGFEGEGGALTGVIEAMLLCPCPDRPMTCVSFDAPTALDGPNPRPEPGATFTGRDANGTLGPFTSISPGDGLRIGATTEIDLDVPAGVVEVTTWNGQSLAPLVTRAYDAGGAVVAVHTAGSTQPDTGTLVWPGITRLVIENTVQETLLVRVCFDQIGP